MTALTDVRQALAALLSGVIADVQVFPEFPEAVTPPFIAIGPSDDNYIDFEGAPFGWCRVHLAVTFVADIGTNDVRAGDLDEAIVALVRAVNDSGQFAAISASVGQVGINGQAHLGASVNTITETAL